MRIKLVFLLLLGLCACADAPPRTGTGNRAFRTTAPSHLYFKNMRAADYTTTEDEATRADIYRYRDYPDTAAVPMLLPVIVDNWLEDEAYIRFQLIPYPEGYAMPLRIVYPGSEGADTLVLTGTGPVSQLAFAESLYARLQRNATGSVVTKSGSLSKLTPGEDGQIWTKTVLQDYFRLVERN